MIFYALYPIALWFGLGLIAAAIADLDSTTFMTWKDRLVSASLVCSLGPITLPISALLWLGMRNTGGSK